MKIHLLLLAYLASLHTALSAENSSSDWTPLLDKQMSQFQVFIGAPTKALYLANYTLAQKKAENKPLGLNNDPLKVFSVIDIRGELTLHITGQIQGLARTRKAYQNYHFRTLFRWGNAKHSEHADQPRNSGIAYHSEAIDSEVPSGIIFMIEENLIGGYLSKGVSANIARERFSNGTLQNKGSYYSFQNTKKRLNRICAPARDIQEFDNGQWNTIEIIAFEDKAIHVVNGKVANVLSEIQTNNTEKTLSQGLIQLISDGAECDFQRMEIRPINAIPPEYQNRF